MSTTQQFRRPKKFDRSRYPYPKFSDKEYDRRWKLTREMMKKRGLDCLMVTGLNLGWEQGWSNVRYLTNYAGSLDNVCYVVLPMDGDITICTWTSQIDRVARSIVDDIRCARANYETAAGRLKELHLEHGNIGLVPPNWNLQIPYDQMTYFMREFPQAKFPVVFEDFMRDVRWVKSSEEIEWISKAAHLGDLMQEALVKKMKPGVTEHEIYGTAYDTIISNGGEEGMTLMATNNTYDSDSPDTRVRPMPRKLDKGYLLNIENGPVYNGYVAQTGKPICIGEPSQEYKKMFEICLQAYKGVSDAIRVGNTEEDIRNGGKAVYDNGYIQVGAPFLHGMHGGFPQDGPVVAYAGLTHEVFQPFEIRANTTWTVEISVASQDEMKGIFMADTFLATDGAPKRLQKLEPQLFISG